MTSALVGSGGGKTGLALVLGACARLGIRDPAEFYALPDHVQRMWVEDTTNDWTGAYAAPRKASRPGRAMTPAEERAAILARRGDR